jgi:hypothetical protein
MEQKENDKRRSEEDEVEQRAQNAKEERENQARQSEVGIQRAGHKELKENDENDEKQRGERMAAQQGMGAKDESENEAAHRRESDEPDWRDREQRKQLEEDREGGVAEQRLREETEKKIKEEEREGVELFEQEELEPRQIQEEQEREAVKLREQEDLEPRQIKEELERQAVELHEQEEVLHARRTKEEQEREAMEVHEQEVLEARRPKEERDREAVDIWEKEPQAGQQQEAETPKGEPNEAEPTVVVRDKMEVTVDHGDSFDDQYREEEEEAIDGDSDEGLPAFPVHTEYDHERNRAWNFEVMADYLYDVLEYYAVHAKTSVDTTLDQIIAHRLSNSRATNPYNVYLAMRREDPNEQDRLRALGIPTKGTFATNLLCSTTSLICLPRSRKWSCCLCVI